MNTTNIILKQVEIGPLDNFVYLIGDPATHQAAVVDPAWDVEAILKTAQENGLTITHILLTHGHPDHVNGLDALLARCPVPVVISRHEAPFYVPNCPGLQYVDHGDRVRVGELEIECLHTPGHTPGGLCFRAGNILLTGDTLFIDGCGRCDLPGGSASIMYDSLYNIISRLPEQTIIYPGHNYGRFPFATLAAQKGSNPYLRCTSKKEFLLERMGQEPEE